VVNKAISKDSFTCTMTSDASLSGWGAHLDVSQTKGHWNYVESEYHINILELLAVFNAVRAFNIPPGSRVLCRVDNTTAIS